MEIKIEKRIKYAEDIFAGLTEKAGFPPDVAIDFLNGIPDADAELVRHERWIREDEFSSVIDVPWLCSGCNLQLLLSGIYTPNGYGYHYCPNCGAKMDRKEETE